MGGSIRGRNPGVVHISGFLLWWQAMLRGRRRKGFELLVSVCVDVEQYMCDGSSFFSSLFLQSSPMTEDITDAGKAIILVHFSKTLAIHKAELLDRRVSG